MLTQLGQVPWIWYVGSKIGIILIWQMLRLHVHALVHFVACIISSVPPWIYMLHVDSSACVFHMHYDRWTPALAEILECEKDDGNASNLMQLPLNKEEKN